MRLAARIENLERLAEQKSLGEIPLVVGCRRVGEDGESRPPGVYRDGARQSIVVFEGEPPDAEELARYFPGHGPLPLLIGGEARVDLL